MMIAFGPCDGLEVRLSSASLDRHKEMTALPADRQRAIMGILAEARRLIDLVMDPTFRSSAVDQAAAGHQALTSEGYAREYSQLGPLDPRD